MLRHFAGDAWLPDLEAGLDALGRDPASPNWVDTLQRGCALVHASRAECLAYVRANFVARPGLAELVAAAERRGIEVHVVGFAFDLYVEDFLREAGVLDRVSLHCGRVRETGDGLSLEYVGPRGAPVQRSWKETWADHFRRSGELIYTGDGRSDVGAAVRARLVFARDDLLASMPPSYEGVVSEFDTLLDVARGLDEGL